MPLTKTSLLGILIASQTLYACKSLTQGISFESTDTIGRSQSSAPEPSWQRWDDVSASLLAESSLPQNYGEPSAETLAKAIEFCLVKRDFTRVEWLNSRFLESKDPRKQALGQFYQGRLHARLDDFDRTEESWQRALRLDPDNQNIKKRMGLLYAQFGFFARALTTLKPFEDETPIAITLVAMERQLGLSEQADRRCELLLKPNDPPAEAFFNCSLLEFQNHRNAVKAIEWMEQAQRKAPVDSNLAQNAKGQLGLMLEWRARFQSAR